MDLEIKPFLSRCHQIQAIQSREWRGWSARFEQTELIVWIIGVRCPRFAEIFTSILRDYPPPTRVVLAGFSGGLSSDLAVGEVISPTVFCDLNGSFVPGEDTEPTDAIHVTSPYLLFRQSQKVECRQSTQAIAVDMESYWVVKSVRSFGISIDVIRAISDGVADELPEDVGRLISNGKVNWIQLIRLILTRPISLIHLMRLGRNAHRASRALAQALTRWVRDQATESIRLSNDDIH
ncbi:purine or other phosphorylase family 1 : 5'-methylthioadenosine/S-adenosylhomocysteine nucleosidase OS=Planctomyces maris DSM 8797 GN=PM8797T_26275 PE=4 SV=1 [Tuwongella immobilis]|uniref:Purine or other phosphorylase family 1: 5'-methylthioadenosine/S-adenosylhomocysteine nucleosidase n=2 Tax=Tuwongella immobilis TaxID=692036 RepID=A0A6C2YS33_9BACT|nr:purine or other phosphorylase family 1 : 5'-methylthioadenosine/S-adenosylhomocysteine nucleosidase OS=Planctomyces maris DSM 8797 GN=PM8797T_26275 PE=4 SV=1 [Tuwongella immobilis]VTS04752.1 purine or other phosphorylase family 1 : 5'-methylthioadenosine/S-adenosylhomocysteine nucleosidase OS=Planctomyces maris DSM 8797 GN=PM8797T_26275 PE=4 SV=1 [Tuwongella immobilis]